MFKRTLSLILCAVLALCCLAASAAAEAPIEITVAMNGTPTGWPASEDENFIQQQILEKTRRSVRHVPAGQLCPNSEPAGSQ